MCRAVGFQFVGRSVEAHHHAIDVIATGHQFDHRQEGVEIEGSHHHDLFVLLAALAVSQFNTVVQNEALGLSLNLVSFHNSLYLFDVYCFRR